MKEAKIRETETGKAVDGDGWFILNAGEAAWEGQKEPGAWCSFDSRDAPFEHYGGNIHVLQPGQANGRYHGESNQEDFLVLAGECIAIVEGAEYPMRQWDLLHC